MIYRFIDIQTDIDIHNIYVYVNLRTWVYFMAVQHVDLSESGWLKQSPVWLVLYRFKSLQSLNSIMSFSAWTPCANPVLWTSKLPKFEMEPANCHFQWNHLPPFLNFLLDPTQESPWHKGQWWDGRWRKSGCSGGWGQVCVGGWVDQTVWWNLKSPQFGIATFVGIIWCRGEDLSTM